MSFNLDGDIQAIDLRLKQIKVVAKRLNQQKTGRATREINGEKT
jgi:hypothetical protein